MISVWIAKILKDQIKIITIIQMKVQVINMMMMIMNMLVIIPQNTKDIKEKIYKMLELKLMTNLQNQSKIRLKTL